ncbi:hypothetical protein [Escherichia coli]
MTETTTIGSMILDCRRLFSQSFVALSASGCSGHWCGWFSLIIIE